VISAEVQHVQAFGGAFGFVNYIAAIRVKTVAALTAEAVFEAVFRHVVAVTSAAGEPVRKIIRGTSARYLPTIPIGAHAAHY
jgi:hypothetical protein